MLDSPNLMIPGERAYVLGGIDILFVKIGSFLMTGQPFINVGRS